jgi:hypothetical protein
MVKGLTFIVCVMFGTIVPQSHHQTLSRIIDWCLT